MTTYGRSRRFLSVALAGAFLAGCGAQSMAPGAMQRGFAVSPDGGRGPSRMAAGAGKWDLLYVSNGNATVTVYRYWQHTLVGTLTGFKSPMGECVDKAGDVYVTDRWRKEVVEYAHGGKEPINVIKLAPYEPYGCSIDPVSGKLAVANYAGGPRGSGSIAVYQHAAGKPTFYTDAYIYNPVACAYDIKGNLFATSIDFSGSKFSYFAYLPKGRNSFEDISLGSSSSYYDDVTSVQWDGKFWTVEGTTRFTIANGQATLEGYTSLKGLEGNQNQEWISNFSGDLHKQGTQVVVAEYTPDVVQIWKYPAGGQPIAAITDGISYPYGVTVSLAPNR